MGTCDLATEYPVNYNWQSTKGQREMSKTEKSEGWKTRDAKELLSSASIFMAW